MYVGDRRKGDRTSDGHWNIQILYMLTSYRKIESQAEQKVTKRHRGAGCLNDRRRKKYRNRNQKQNLQNRPTKISQNKYNQIQQKIKENARNHTNEVHKINFGEYSQTQSQKTQMRS